MIKQGHVGTPELFALTGIYQIILIFFNLPVILTEKATTGAWLLNVLLCGASFLFFLPIFFLLKRFPGQAIGDIAGQILGTPGRLIVSGLVSGFYLGLVVIFIRVGAAGIINTILVKTPLRAIMVMGFFAVMVVSYLGFEALTRTALIFFPFILTGLGIVAVLSAPDVDIYGIYPLLGVPVKDQVINATLLAPVTHEFLFMAIIAPYMRQGKSVISLVLWSLILTVGISTVMVMLMQMSFPYPEIKSIPFPLFQLVRMIYLGRFLQRIEALYVIMAVVSTTIHLCMLFHLCVLSLAQGLKLTDWRPVIFPVGVITFAVACLPENAIEITRWYYSVPNILLFASVTLILPAGLYGLAVIKGKKGGARVGEKKA